MTMTALGRAAGSAARRFALEPLGAPAPAWIDLAGGDLYEATPATVRAATVVAVERHQADHYTRRPGIAPLCKRVVEGLAALGVAASLDGVIVTGGLAEARFLALRALGAGRRVLLPLGAPPEPYRVAAQLAGATLERFALDGELPPARDAILLLPDPGPATGECLPAEQVERLARWAAAEGVLVVADMALAGLLVDPSRLHPLAARPEAAGRTVAVGGFADTPGLDAWQVAWCAGPAPVMGPALELKQAMTICSPAVSQYAALAGGEAERRAVRSERAARLAAVTGLLARLGVPYREPQTLAYVVADVSALGGGERVAGLCAMRGVGIAAGETLGDPGLIRITAIAGRLDEGLARLEAALTEARGGQ